MSYDASRQGIITLRKSEIQVSARKSENSQRKSNRR
jgi:hypothetical protein